PRRMTASSVGYDVFSPVDAVVPAGGDQLIKTGIKAYFQKDEVLYLFPRSSWANTHGVTLKNGVGVIEADYYDNPDNEGELIVMLYNRSDVDFSIKKGDRFCQAVFQKVLHVDGDTLENGDGRQGGMGSTGR
ncbi:MAG: dUTP diphosphatase, partial [Nanoarchaeota archaeon]